MAAVAKRGWEATLETDCGVGGIQKPREGCGFPLLSWACRPSGTLVSTWIAQLSRLFCFLSCPGDRQPFTGRWSHKWQKTAKWLKLMLLKAQITVSICESRKQQRHHCALHALLTHCILHYCTPPSSPPVPSSFRELVINMSCPRRVSSPPKNILLVILNHLLLWEFLDCFRAISYL